MLARVEGFLRRDWNRLGLDYLGEAPPRGALRWAVINGGLSVRSKLVCPFWKGKDLMPFLMVKVARYPRYNHRLSVEHQALETVQQFLPAGRATAPRPIFQTEIDGTLVVAESALPARPVRAYLREHPAEHGAQLKRMQPFAEWLAWLHVRSARPAGPQRLQQFVFGPIEAAEAELDLSPGERAGLERLRVAAASASSVPLQLGFNHNDAGSTNVMADQSGNFAGLIDWESGAFGLPAVDLIYFLARYAYETRAAGTDDQLRGFREFFFRQRSGAAEPMEMALTAAWLRDYCRRAGLDPRWMPLLFGLCWIMHARNERDHLLGLRAEGQLLYGKPATVTAAAADREVLERGHFRSQLRFYLLNLDSFVLSAESQV